MIEVVSISDFESFDSDDPGFLCRDEIFHPYLCIHQIIDCLLH